MQTFETSLQTPDDRELLVTDSIALMGATTVRLIAELRSIYDDVRGEERGLTVALFGSPARHEMLPYSDIDLLLIDEPSSTSSAKQDVLQRTRTLTYDKIDTPATNIITSGGFLDFAMTNSPDAHIAKSLIVASPDGSEVVMEMESARSRLDDSYLQLEGLIFDYHFLKYRAEQKTAGGAPNLKYSDGGSRDILYLDWAADYISGAEASRTSIREQTPQVSLAIPIVVSFLEGFISEDQLRRTVDTINTLKHDALHLKHAGIHFDGRMTHETALHLVAANDYGLESNEPDALIAHYLHAQSVLRSTKDALYGRLIVEVRERGKYDDAFSHLDAIDRLWRNDDDLNREEAVRMLLSSGRWVDLGTVVSQPDASPLDIDIVVEHALSNSAYSHALRNAIRHPNTSRATLQKLLDAERLAADDDIHERYLRMLAERLEKQDE